MKNALVAPVALDFFFDRLEIGQQVSVRENHTSRLCRGARGEDNLDGDAATNRWRWKASTGTRRQSGTQVFKTYRWNREPGRRNLTADDSESYAGLLCHAPCKRLIRNRVHGHGH